MNYFLAVTGVAPCFRLKTRYLKRLIFRGLYFVFSLVVVIICTALIIIEKKQYLLKKHLTVPAFISLITPLLNCFLALQAMISIHFWLNERYHEFTSLFDKLDDLVYKYIRKVNVHDKKSYRKIILWKVIFPILFCLTHIIYTYVFVSAMFCLETFMRHLMTFRVVMLQHYIQQIGYRYEIVERIVSTNTQDFMRGSMKEAQFKLALHDMAKILSILDDIIILFNKLFGWLLFMLMLCVIFGILYYINNAITFFKFLNTQWVGIFIFWSCFHMVRKKICLGKID